jgi:hypothetical protein
MSQSLRRNPESPRNLYKNTEINKKNIIIIIIITINQCDKQVNMKLSSKYKACV